MRKLALFVSLLMTIGTVAQTFVEPQVGGVYKIKGDNTQYPWLTATKHTGGGIVVSGNEEDAALFLRTQNGLQDVATGKYIYYPGSGAITIGDNESAVVIGQYSNETENGTKYSIRVAGNPYLFNNNTDGQTHESGSFLNIERYWGFIEVLPSYAVLPEGMNASNFEELFGENTVTDGTTYYKTLKDALNGIHKQNVVALYCKPGANLGTMTHGHVCASLTIYGNGAKMDASGEQDFELDTYTGINGQGGSDIASELTFTVKHLDGCGAWGQRNSAHTLNIVFEDCKDMNRVYLNGTTGVNNITLTNCSFSGSLNKSCTLYSNANGTITVDCCEFANVAEAINLNHKAAGTQTISITNTTFSNVGANAQAYQAPIRVLSSVEGGVTTLTVTDCEFINSVYNEAAMNADILLDYGVGEATLAIDNTAANVTVETENNVGTATVVTEEDEMSFSNALPAVAKIGNVEYASLEEAIAAVNEGETITLVADVNYENVASATDKTTSVNVPAGKKFTLNLNGYTLSGTNSSNGNFSLMTICSGADVTIEDTSAEKTGKVSYASTRETPNENHEGYTVRNKGKLTLNSGTVENVTPLAGNGYEKCVTTAIDNCNSTGAVFTFTMNGGVVKSDTYFAIRNNVYAGNTCDAGAAIVQLNGGTVYGLHFCEWGSKNLDYQFVIGKNMVVECGNYPDFTDQAIRLVIGTAATSKITVDIAEEAQINGKIQNAVAKIGTRYYTNLQKAIDAVQAGETITLISDIKLTAQNAQEYFKPAYNRESYCGIVIPDDKTVTLNLNGKTVSYTDAYGDVDNVMILNLGNLTIDDSSAEKNGKLTYKAVAGTTTYSKFYSTIFNCGTLTINAGTVENTCETETDVTNAVDNHSRLSHEYGNDCVLTVNGGTLSGAYYYAIRQYTHYFEGVQNRVVINDGDINGGIYMQHGDSWYYADPAKNRLNVDCYLTVNGGNINLDTTPDAFGKIKSRLNNPDNNAFDLEINGGNINVPVELLVQRGVFYTNGVSGATTAAEAVGTRNAEWLEKNGGFITGGTFAEIGSAEEPTMNVAAFVAEGYQLKANEDGTCEVIVEPALSGEGTEANPYLINNIDDLVFFRNSVNEGKENKYNAPGVWVALGADIDMTGENWVAIGLATTDHGFMGNFDGKGYKIQNLTIIEPALDSDGYAYAGLFGVTEGTDKDNQNTIKNLTIENVTITTDGHIVSAAIAYPYYTIVEDVTVCGDIAIEGGYYTAGVLAYTRCCVDASNLAISGNEGSNVKGTQTVGGVISDIQMNGGLTANYSNFSAEGITVTGDKNVGGISGIISGQALDGVSVKNVTLDSDDARVGIVAGSLGAASTITNAVAENVTGATALIGATYDGAKAIEAKIGNTYYSTVEAAMKADGLVESLLPIALTDGEEYVAYEENCQVGQLSYTRTLSAANVWMPLYVPFEIPVEMLGEDYEVATFHAYHETLDESGYVVEGGAYVELVKIKGGTLYANRPYLIKAKNEAALEMNLELTDAVLYGASSERLTVTCSSATHEFTFSGTYQKSDRVALGYEEGKTACFAMSGGSLAAMSENATLGAYRIYMTSTVKPGAHYAATSAAHAILLRVIGEESADGTTVIYDVENDAQDADRIYDLQGRRVQEPQKGGLYIINGKKVIF